MFARQFNQELPRGLSSIPKFIGLNCFKLAESPLAGFAEQFSSLSASAGAHAAVAAGDAVSTALCEDEAADLFDLINEISKKMDIGIFESIYKISLFV